MQYRIKLTSEGFTPQKSEYGLKWLDMTNPLLSSALAEAAIDKASEISEESYRNYTPKPAKENLWD